MGVSFEEAEQMKLSDSGGISASSPDQEQTDAVMSHDVLEAMENVANEIADQLNRSMEFYGATSPDPRPSHIYLGGGCASLKLLERTIINRLGIGVTVIDPFNRIGLGGHDNSTRLAAIAPAASVVVGLALEISGGLLMPRVNLLPIKKCSAQCSGAQRTPGDCRSGYFADWRPLLVAR